MDVQLKFAPFSSSPDAGFWYKLTQKKLEEFGLDDTEVSIRGHYTNADAPGLPSCLTVEHSAFEPRTPKRCFAAHGILDNRNTLDEFKDCDKKSIIEAAAREIWVDIKSGSCIQDPQRLVRFYLLAFADLKKYKYHYWFAFPAISAPISLVDAPKRLLDKLTNEQVVNFLAQYDNVVESTGEGFFVLTLAKFSDPKEVKVSTLRDYDEHLKFQDSCGLSQNSGAPVFGFCDPCTLDLHPGWPLRNYLALIASRFVKDKDQCEVQVLCFRDRHVDGRRDVSRSIILTVSLARLSLDEDAPTTAGWEKNTHNKYLPRMLDLGAIMNPERLADEAVNLNLKLMRWRLLPDLNLEAIASTRCLLFGAGTLGCNVARCLMGWGVRNITFVDNGRIAYSNPVRQSLFTFPDCLNGGKPKAQAAADALKQIFPGMNANAHALTVPMPGHIVTESTRAQVVKDVEVIKALVDSNDAIFLLTDTRESRWLPSLLSAAAGKVVINAALGFDTWLVMRHGVQSTRTQSADSLSVSSSGADPHSTNGSSSVESDGIWAVAAHPVFDAASISPECTARTSRGIVTGDQLGCYFCNDVVAPRDSTRDRTLDQQCTVSRPGLSMMAAGLAVELLMSVLQHPQRGHAPASLSNADDIDDQRCLSLLGIVPHQLRGFLSRFHILSPVSRAFDKCSACSASVIEQYREHDIEFLMKVFNEPGYLEEVTGLIELHSSVPDIDVLDLSDCSDDE